MVEVLKSKSTKELKIYAENFRKLLDRSYTPPTESFKYRSNYHLLKEHGLIFKFKSDDVHGTQPKKQCYRNAFMAVLENPELVYVEGIAFPKGIIPLDHAWTMNKNGEVFDPTWNDGEAYFGLPIKKEYLMEQTLKNKKYGIIFGSDFGNKDILLGNIPLDEWRENCS